MPRAASLLMLVALASLLAGPVAHAHAQSARATRTTWTARTTVADPGTYDVVVSIARPSRARRDVIDVFVANASRRGVVVTSRRDTRVRLRGRIAGRVLTARVVGRRSRPRARIASVRAIRVTPAAAAPGPAGTPPATPTTPAQTSPATPTMDTPAQPLPSTLIWADEFDGPAGSLPDPGRWSAQTGGGGWGNGELQTYTGRAQNGSLDGAGALAITARRETYTGADGITRDYTSARLQTKGRFSFAYGRMEARVRIPAGKGLWPAFWALGDDISTVHWPQCGEIDVMEVLGDTPATVHGTAHGPNGTPSGWAKGVTSTSPASLAGDFHVYGVIWTPDAISWALDGTVYGRLSRADVPPGGEWVFDHAFHLLLNLAVGGSWPGAPDGLTPFPATMLVDWVRVYQ